MEAFRTHTGLVAAINRTNIDTDAIIPKQFLKRIERSGFGQFLFYEWRYDIQGQIQNDFILNKSPWNTATILLANANFGCGSSREHAPWALKDFGFSVIIAPSFADIFYNNCFKNGILPVRLPQNEIDRLFALVQKKETYTLKVDLQKQTIEGDSFSAAFEIDEDRKEYLEKGLDDIGLTLQHEEKIAEFEARHI